MIPSFEQRRCAGHRLVAQTWGAIGGAAVSVVGGALMGGGGDKNGGAGTQTQSKEPWGPAQPWIMNNLQQGQMLQNAYTAQPFSNAQTQAYNNQGNQSSYMRALVPDLLGQISGQKLGFDRANQNARPNAFNFAGNSNLQGLLAQMASGANNSSPMDNTPKMQQPEDGKFMQQSGVVNGMNMSGLNTGALNGDPRAFLNGQSGGTLLGNGGYGTFKYGMQPQPGTQQYRDMSLYFANGGVDPNNYYGKGGDYRDPSASPISYLFGGHVNGGVGIGDTGANAAAAASGNTGW